MKKRLIIVFTLLLTLLVVSTSKVSAQSQSIVHNQEELKQAITNKEITSIIIDNDINTTEKITITRPLSIDGQNHTVKYTGTFGASKSSDKTVWGGIYVFQVYKTEVTFKNIKLTGANAALLVNGGNVKLEGTIDVSGNGFGGIELSQGKDVTTTAQLNLSDDINIVNTTESSNAPTLWVPKDTEKSLITMNGVTKTITAGEELTLNEVEDLFESANPNTSDTLVIPGILALISLILLIKNYAHLKSHV